MAEKNQNDQNKLRSDEEQKQNANTQPGPPDERELNAGEDTAVKSDRKGSGQQQQSGGNPVIN